MQISFQAILEIQATFEDEACPTLLVKCTLTITHVKKMTSTKVSI